MRQVWGRGEEFWEIPKDTRGMERPGQSENRALGGGVALEPLLARSLVALTAIVSPPRRTKKMTRARPRRARPKSAGIWMTSRKRWLW